MRNYFILDGTDSRDFGLYLNGAGTFDSPSRSVAFIQVPGRNGDLIGLSTRLENGVYRYQDAFIFQNFETNMAAFRAFLLSKTGYRRLTDTYHPDTYRLVTFTGPLSPEVTPRNDAGRFTIELPCMPQRFLLSGETVVTLTATGSINNPTRFSVRPLLRVYGAGVLGVAGVNITISAADVYTDIDCESGRAYKGATPRDRYVTLSSIDYPALQPGANGITLGTGITRVEITPRWYTV